MEAAVKSFLNHKLEYVQERSAIAYKGNLQGCFKRLRVAGYDCLPYDLDENAINYLIKAMRRDNLTIKTQKNYINALRGYLEYFNNRVFDNYPIRWPHDTRPSVRWLTQNESIMLASHIFDDEITNIMIHCELCLGMRRIEVLRLKPEDFGDRYVKISGKGKIMPKIRYLPIHRDTKSRLDRYMSWRDEQIAIAKKRRPVSTIVPDDLIIWRKFYTLGTFEPFGAESLNKRLRRAGEEVGIERLSHHMLRRSFGRALWLSGVKLETISMMMGHESVDQTIKYIGVNMSDMDAAMEKFIL